MKNGLPKKLNYNGNSVDLGHLHPFTHKLSGHGLGGQDLILRVGFRSHVFSIKPRSRGHDFLDENNNQRDFCPIRYEFSFCLPGEVRKMLDNNVFTWEERDKNQMTNLAVIAPARSNLDSGLHNTLFYHLYPSKLEHIDVEFSVKTCYEKQINFNRKRRQKKEKIRGLVKKAHYQNTRIPKN
ncbi:MAG: hypothetical protein ACRBBK_06585 [Paracoccaceae bacterium]